MAVGRTRGHRDRVDIWPGFVDALSTLLLVIMFLLVVFVLAQFFLGQILQGRDVTLERLESRIADLQQQLDLERETASELRGDLARVTAELQALRAEKEDVEARLSESEADRDVLDRQLVRLRGEQQVLEQSLRDVTAERSRLAERLEVREEEIARLNGMLEQLRGERERATLTAQEAQARVRSLREQIAALSEQLVGLSGLLDARQAEIERQSARIAELGTRLNLALASKVEELSRYRSDFFGRLRQVLGDRPDIRIVGDRFVFQSEVLFATGEAEIGESGKRELAKFADAFKEIMAEIPDDLPWVLQIDGHTDKRPIHTPRFPSNWELSAARAIAVANFLISRGIPPERVAARGFAEFQPLDPGDSEEAYRRNRRIEIKLTTR